MKGIPPFIVYCFIPKSKKKIMILTHTRASLINYDIKTGTHFPMQQWIILALINISHMQRCSVFPRCMLDYPYYKNLKLHIEWFESPDERFFTYSHSRTLKSLYYILYRQQMTSGEDFSNFCDINAMHTSMTKVIQWGNVRRLPNFGDSLLS